MFLNIKWCFYERNKLNKQDFGLCGPDFKPWRPQLARGLCMLCMPDLNFNFLQGREYDEEGNMRQWWNNVTLNTFKNRTACMENQVQ